VREQNDLPARSHTSIGIDQATEILAMARKSCIAAGRVDAINSAYTTGEMNRGPSARASRSSWTAAA
jgi:hypothetical protein